ncbi:hypothetical protein FSP39_014591 [Pinctada imbricata]|uniref:Uncharacterized protein n=1 Tax=Pinctada imbricata TaxID=66713 RepID=A0AA89BMC9_PINIB|nr:hypothetical protein FSP39_014591 [Pinctada imbricata]
MCTFRNQEDEANLNLIRENLRLIQNKQQVKKRKDDIEIQKLVQNRFSWLPKANTVSNVFITPASHDAIVQNFNAKNSSLVFVHQPRGAGSHVTSCMNSISIEKRHSLSPVMNLQNRLLWDSSSVENRQHQEAVQLHRGPFAFGLCENLNRKCAYFTIFRDPFDTLVSLFTHCKANRNDDLCKEKSASNSTLYDWVFENAGVLFHRLLFSSEHCKYNHNSSDSTNVNIDSCNNHHRNRFEMLSTNTEKIHLATYIKSHLHKWFAAIGLFNEIENSMLIFERAFEHPFSRCKSRDKSSFYENSLVSNNAHFERVRSDEDVYNYDDDEEEDFIDEIQTVKEDINIQNALKYDYIIYNEAKRLYHIQKQVLYNKLGNT